MKLAYSPASPYVRKVTACAIKRGIDKQIERMKISTTDPELLKYNALSKVPTLITGSFLFASTANAVLRSPRLHLNFG